MHAQAVHLIPQRLLCNFKIRWLPLRPPLPEITAAPSGHDQDSFSVSEIKEFLCLELAFEPDRVQSHVLHIAKFILQPLRILTQHHVGRPSTAANQDVLAVNVERSAAYRVEIRCNFADAEFRVRLIADRATTSNCIVSG